MKSLLIFTLILFLSPINKVNDIKIINKGIYVSYYSEHYKNPVKVTYLSYKPLKLVDRKGKPFYQEPGLQTNTDADFKNNVWDQGHCCPAASFSNNYDDLHKTFSSANRAVQHENLNSGAWEQLEVQERVWAGTDSLFVTCDVILSSKSKKLLTGTYIPDKFRKTIMWVKTKKKSVWEFPNTVCPGKYTQYKIK